MPEPVGVLVPLVVSLFLAVALIGRTFKAWRVASVVVVSQAMFHALFVLGSPGSAMDQSSGAMHHSLSNAVVVSAHAMQTPAMSIGHLFAAMVTTVALVRGEIVLRGLLSRAREVLVRIRWAVPTPIVAVRQSRPAADHRSVVRRADVGPHATRGPPWSI